MSETALTPYQRPSVDDMVAMWLHAKRTSKATHRRYESEMAHFRAMLQPQGLDLDSNAAVIASLAQGWATVIRTSEPGPATINLRLAALSSFYAYAIRSGHEGWEVNPITRIERAKVQQYANAQALSYPAVKAKLAAIDTSTLDGLRDKTLLMLALTTGRRLAEVAAMRREHLATTGIIVTVTFPHAKGGKVMRDELTRSMSSMLYDYLRAVNASGIRYDPQAIWIAFGPHNRGGALKPRAIERICEQRLGLQHFHALRHTFAQAMEQAGAKVSEIQARLGHSNLATTGRYLAQLSSDKNPYAGIIESYFTDEE